jgi:hypothetical protein
MRLLLAAVAFTASSNPGPGPGLSEAVRAAMVDRWYAVAVWNDVTLWNTTVTWNKRVTVNATHPSRSRRSPTTSPREPSSWDAIAQCESGRDWTSSAGQYEGGLQFDPATWTAYGGGDYAEHAYQATRDEQIAVAERVLAGQGRGAWPVCGYSR